MRIDGFALLPLLVAPTLAMAQVPAAPKPPLAKPPADTSQCDWSAYEKRLICPDTPIFVQQPPRPPGSSTEHIADIMDASRQMAVPQR